MKELEYPFESDVILSSRKRLRRTLLGDGQKRINKKIAVLGGSTTSDVIKTAELFLLNDGIECEFFESEYNRWWQDAVFGTPELEEFTPDVIYIHTNWRNVEGFFPSIGGKSAKECVEECMAHFTKAWESLSERFNCPIIQNNVELPPYRMMGNRECWDNNGTVRFINELNDAFADYAASHKDFYIHDISYTAAAYGLDKWHDLQAWYMYKLSMALEAIPYVSYGMTRIVKSIFGKNKKTVVLDLDNTLWGGVVGDDGVEGIQIGRENAEAECFEEFQKYLKKFNSMGVMLTVASKNDHENAIAGLNHPEGILRPDDFIVIKANWETKDRNIVNTADEMNLGVDSFVFIDDNPTERALVSRSVKGISVPEVTTPDSYIHILDRSGFFEVTAFSADDVHRNDMYKANSQRAQKQTEFADYGEYLLSLDMQAEILPFSPVYIPRITQLTNKSNQFNLTTRRYTQPQIEEAANDENCITLYGKLADIYGDNGVVSVVIADTCGNIADVKLWLMSCRVLKKDMEYAMLDTLVETCRKKGIEAIIGHYYPTPKNGMVKGLFADFGFEKLSEDEAGNTEWRLDINGYANKNRYIKVNSEETEKEITNV